MGRQLRIEYQGALYHITSRGNGRKKIFRDDGDRTHFLEILADYHHRFSSEINSHLCFLIKEEYCLSSGITLFREETPCRIIAA
jgi:hypothetical protein